MTSPRKRCAQLPCGVASVLPSSHLTASCGELNFGASARSMITLQRWPGERPVLATRSIGDAALGRRDNRRHVSQVADLLLVREHLVDDERALQRVLKLDFAARRKVLFPQLQCPDHHR